MANFDKRLKNILVKAGRLAAEVADEALEASGGGETSFSDIVLERGLIDEKDLIATVAGEINLPPIDLSRLDLEDEVLTILPHDLASYYGVLPISKIGDVLTLAVANPFDILKLDDVKIVTGCEIRPVISTERSIQRAITTAYGRGTQAMDALLEGMASPEVELAELEDDRDVDLLDTESADSPVVKIVNMLIFQAVRDRASDIHVEPFEKKIRVRLRQDGVLRELPLSPPRKMLNALISRLKIMADLDIAERRVPQDGKFQIRIEGRQIDFRVSILPTIFGEKAVMRLLDTSNLSLRLDDLGFEPEVLAQFRNAITSPYGMVLVTGPTGSGKTTTLYSAIREILSTEDNIVTVEEPVEYQIEGINQVSVNVKRGLTFAVALRSILRQDPDIIMIGEIRDLETVEIAVKAALTGHLVLSTLHTNDAASTVTRLIDMGVDPFMISASVLLASAQRLVRRLCPQCKEEVPPPPKERLLEIGFREEETEGLTVYRPVGCSRCAGGYRGRLALLETIPATEAVKRTILRRESALDIKQVAMQEGMISLRRAGLRNVIRGHTSVEEVLSVTMPD